MTACVLAALMVWPAAGGAPHAGERFVPIDGMVICGPATPTDSEALAVSRFNKRIAAFTGRPLAVCWGASPDGVSKLRVGTRSDCREVFGERDWNLPEAIRDADMSRQAFALDHAGEPDGPATVYAFGFGEAGDARSSLGLGYALGELLRRLDIRDGAWGIALPGGPCIRFPETPNRTLYLMNSYNCSQGLSIEFASAEQIEDYVDFLVEAKYSRVNLWQWAQLYLYPGSNEPDRPRNQQIHQAMRRLFAYARLRGLEVYHGLTPVHVNLDLLPNDPALAGTGYYGRSGICWSRPEGRALAREMARTEMEYYGPVDGYIVWFYDPGGCFCDSCKPNQATNIFEQLLLVEDLARTISPGAEFQAVLWPTWVWHEYQDQGIPFTEEEADAVVRGFLEQALAHFGPRVLTILDSCEADYTNVYNGLVDPAQFKRSAFMYSVLGMASEHGYPFAPFRFQYLYNRMRLATQREVEDGNLFIQYAFTNRPGVYVFADALYGNAESWQECVKGYASTFAKGPAFDLAVVLLEALERSGEIGAYAERDGAIAEAERLWDRLATAEGFYGDRDWMSGYVRAQRCYLELARAADQGAFDGWFAQFKQEVGALPMYSDYMQRSMTPQLCVNLHLKAYWRGPGEDYRLVGLPEE